MAEAVEQKTKYFYLALFFFLLYLSFLMMKPFLIAVFASFVMAYLIYPVYNRLNVIIKNRSACAAVLLILLSLAILIPAFLLGSRVVDESVSLYYQVVNVDLNKVNDAFHNYLNVKIDLEAYLKIGATKLLGIFSNGVSEFTLSLPRRVLLVFISVFIMYYLLKEGDTITYDIKKYLPLKDEYKNEVVEKLGVVAYATVYGVLATALVQSIVGTIGLFIFDVNSPIVFGLLMLVTAMLPFGSAIVWLPLVIIKLLNGDIFNGIGLLLYGMLVIGMVDNIVRPAVISKKSRTHPILVVLGVVGGISLFGFIGVIIGPMLLAVLMAFLDFYIREYEV